MKITTKDHKGLQRTTKAQAKVQSTAMKLDKEPVRRIRSTMIKINVTFEK